LADKEEFYSLKLFKKEAIMEYWPRRIIILGLIIFLLVSVSCAPGNQKFEEKSAGFWAGLWHGLICVVTFIISLFTDSVRMYEVNNTGNWYNLGFLLGAAIILGGSRGPRKSKKRKREKEWEEIGVKVEEKVRKGIQSWVDESKEKSAEEEMDWKEVGTKVEEKIKRELRKWAEK
jgi:hypothetical protein